MEFSLYLVMLGLGIFGSFFSALLGIGGAIINYPLILYVPALLGVGYFNAQEVSSISMFQVFFASLAGVWAYRRHHDDRLIHKGLVLTMGISILIGSLVGGVLSRFFPNEAINMVYGLLAVVAVVLLLIPTRVREEAVNIDEVTFDKRLAITISLIVGLLSGVVGAGGAFILIPIMLTILKIPTRITIASSLAIVFLSAIGGTIGKLTTGYTPFLPTLFTVIGGLIGAPLGAIASKGINVKVLRYGLVVLISLTAMKIWSGILLD
ncbi:sulfite exporter TauE/SafE family protein [Ammoniphilus sp. CFH 90114]|uniref:sulfite exporter TauE/SafE family protein n=1 Tax=Ammoniphilus sp. CFH 90114 TaxID=2493665 RepID=UPI00100F4FA4|nr:sulfite exporter TauE/SafE family protein [Ammoniphilus sp. CFH 90114]RXT07996.1 sulfite exporter TauE/SafE family protein [Ammoniphilus sp. CFH 90114]